MENASKALLIAAAILIAILLIAMGVSVFRSTSGTTEQVDKTMQSTEVAMFNNQFLPYIGTNKSKNDAMSLLNIIMATNSGSSTKKIKLVYIIKADDGTEKKTAIPITPEQAADHTPSTVTVINTAINAVASCTINNKFNIVIGGYSSNGYISVINITN